jgi:hypothetical protein
MEPTVILEILCEFPPPMGKPVGHEIRLLLQPMITDGRVEVLGKTPCGGYFVCATDAGREFIRNKNKEAQEKKP